MKKFILMLYFLSTPLIYGAELLNLDVIEYKSFEENDPESLEILRNALYQKGIVGIRGIPEFKNNVQEYLIAAQKFHSLPEEIKESCAPGQQGEVTDLFLGYMAGREQFQLPSGQWVIDDLKVSYYAYSPDHPENKWPLEINIRDPYLNIAEIMGNMGEAVMEKIGLMGPQSNSALSETVKLGRMLYYKSAELKSENEYWCGTHFDHGLFTALLPAFYLQDGKPISEPEEAGLFVNYQGKFYKVASDDPDVLLFQVGEFGQLAMNDEIMATEHRVHKSIGPVERHTIAMFFSPPEDSVIYSTSKLTEDSRYGARPGEACSFAHWNEASLRRYIVEE